MQLLQQAVDRLRTFMAFHDEAAFGVLDQFGGALLDNFAALVGLGLLGNAEGLGGNAQFRS